MAVYERRWVGIQKGKRRDKKNFYWTAQSASNQRALSQTFEASHVPTVPTALSPQSWKWTPRPRVFLSVSILQPGAWPEKIFTFWNLSQLCGCQLFKEKIEVYLIWDIDDARRNSKETKLRLSSRSLGLKKRETFSMFKPFTFAVNWLYTMYILLSTSN